VSRVRLIGKPGCHLCDVARDVVAAECGAAGVKWDEVSILDEADLADRYWELIPVVLVDGIQVAHWFVDPDTLRRALTADLST
jgi:hypothetical protein